jgi:hypothetical protein
MPPDQDGEPNHAGLCGLVEHVGSAERRAFRGPAELLAFVAQCLAAHTAKEGEKR